MIIDRIVALAEKLGVRTDFANNGNMQSRASIILDGIEDKLFPSIHPNSRKESLHRRISICEAFAPKKENA